MTLHSRPSLTLALSVTALLAVTMSATSAQAPSRGQTPGVTGPAANVGPGLFMAVDANKDDAVTREELKTAFDKWFTAWDGSKTGTIAQEQIGDGLAAALPPPPPPPAAGRGGAQNQTPNPADVQMMMAALPDKAPATPKQPRKVLVLGRAAGFVHSSIPLAARTVEEMGKKTRAWSTTITYNAADINEQNLKQYDAIFLASTTGEFLDDPNDAAATAARRKALLEFVRGGKGLAGIHAASDSYHRNAPAAGGAPSAAAAPARGGAAPAAGGGGRGGATNTLATQIVAQGDKNSDRRMTRDELSALADAWFDKLDAQKAGRVSRQDFPQRLSAVFPPAPPARLGPTGFPIQAPASELGPDTQVGTWPEFNKLIGGFFKFHWNDGQVITVKIDEPKHPLNASFKGQSFQIVDETYTFGRQTYSRENLRVLTSIDYAKMSAADKAKEQYPRPDGDYALSWIRREGQGRVFYEAHGHNEKVYAMKPILEHVLAGIQYVLGDLPADDRPSVRASTR